MHVEDYMNETPARLLAMLTQTREDLWQAAKALTERGVTRIILTGSGTSYHGALTARSFMQQWCGLPVDVYWPFLLDDSALTLSDKALVIGISQEAAASLPSPQWNAPGQPGISPLPWPGKRQPLSTGRQIWS
jgi:glucosamine 6-phosphate synthetase-like amidotransferase/phosphosugar isomerase protein